MVRGRLLSVAVGYLSMLFCRVLFGAGGCSCSCSCSCYSLLLLLLLLLPPFHAIVANAANYCYMRLRVASPSVCVLYVYAFWLSEGCRGMRQCVLVGACSSTNLCLFLSSDCQPLPIVYWLPTIAYCLLTITVTMTIDYSYNYHEDYSYEYKCFFYHYDYEYSYNYDCVVSSIPMIMTITMAITTT